MPDDTLDLFDMEAEERLSPTIEEVSTEASALDQELYVDALIEKTYEAAPERWATAAMEAIHILRAVHETFTADDLYQVVGAPEHGSPNAIGAVFCHARKKGYIKATGRFVPATRASSHGRILREWTAASCGRP